LMGAGIQGQGEEIRVRITRKINRGSGKKRQANEWVGPLKSILYLNAERKFEFCHTAEKEGVLISRTGFQTSPIIGGSKNESIGGNFSDGGKMGFQI